MSGGEQNTRLRRGRAPRRVEWVKRTEDKSGTHPRFIAERWLRHSEAARLLTPTEVFVATMINMSLGWPCEDGSWAWVGVDELAERTHLNVTTVKKALPALRDTNGPFEGGSRNNRTGELIVGGHVGEYRSLAFRLRDSILRDPRWQDGYAPERGGTPPSSAGKKHQSMALQPHEGSATALEHSVTPPGAWRYAAQSVASEVDSEASMAEKSSLVDPTVGPESRPEGVDHRVGLLTEGSAPTRPPQQAEPQDQAPLGTASPNDNAPGLGQAAANGAARLDAVQPSRPLPAVLIGRIQHAIETYPANAHGRPAASTIENMLRGFGIPADEAADMPDVIQHTYARDRSMSGSLDSFLSAWEEHRERWLRALGGEAA